MDNFLLFLRLHQEVSDDCFRELSSLSSVFLLEMKHFMGSPWVETAEQSAPVWTEGLPYVTPCEKPAHRAAFCKINVSKQTDNGLWCDSPCLPCVHQLPGTRSLSVIINVQYWIFILLLPVLTGVRTNPRNRMLHLMLLQKSVSVYEEKKRSSHALALNSGVSTTVLELDQASGLFPPKGRSGQSQTACTSDPFCFSDV